MARALIVGCGRRGRALGTALRERGWAVRGTSRSEDGLGPIEAAGIEPALADPEWPGTVLGLVADVAVVHWLLGSARGDSEALAAIHGDRLERLLEKLVDTPVRGFVYEAVGSVDAALLERGRGHVLTAARTWRIPAAELVADPGEPEVWLDEAVSATEGLLSGVGGVK